MDRLKQQNSNKIEASNASVYDPKPDDDFEQGQQPLKNSREKGTMWLTNSKKGGDLKKWGHQKFDEDFGQTSGEPFLG